MVWATGFVETWKRREAALAAEWDVDGSRMSNTAKGVRPEFEGYFRRGVHAKSGHFIEIGSDELPKGVDAPLLEMVPAELPRRRVLCSSTITSILIGVITICSLGLLVFRFIAARLAGVGGSFGVAALNAVFIELSGRWYRGLAHKLTEWENHRSYETHRDSLVLKLAVFSFFNKFYVAFFIAFAKGRQLQLFGYRCIRVILINK
ncbi:calcium-activated chloride channel-domain-containing protein [Pavlovales sp. CCMP2436]|nr:calcium-activated chloride channel-domain-containing protein [Pavlovales sp. CCMP2436]